MGDNDQSSAVAGGSLALRMLIILYGLGIVALGIPHLRAESGELKQFATKQLGGLSGAVSSLWQEPSDEQPRKQRLAGKPEIASKKTEKVLDKLTPDDRKALDRLLNEGVVPR